VGRSIDPAVGTEIDRRFRPDDRQEAGAILRGLDMPFLQDPRRGVERARVQLALVKLAGGDLGTLMRVARAATIDWRDVLVAAGLANADWREVLARDGFSVPEDPGGPA
jgi:hypothetical protein